MKRLFAVLLLLVAPLAFAGSSTVTYTAGQSSAIQTKVIPALNAVKCATYSLPASCTSAQIVTNGCTVKVERTVTVDSCTIFTTNAAGEQALIQELSNQQLVGAFVRQNVLNEAVWRAACSASNQAAQDAACTAVGLSAGCNPCP